MLQLTLISSTLDIQLIPTLKYQVLCSFP